MNLEQEFEDLDTSGTWKNLYNEIRTQSSDYEYKVAKSPENRNLNRYRDVSPFDHSRVKLKNSENDYINASLVIMKEAQRTYILSQGPLTHTCGHFWLMIWEQGTKAVIMLNRVIEKGSEKCAQYWPTGEEQQKSLPDTGFVVSLLSEEDKSYYTIRVLELQNTKTGGTREIYHFHYTSWPDFGVPESPASFLNFLFKVRESGSLGSEHGPPVVHCSAGIGRSGTFSLVDTCLVLMDKRKDPSSVDIQRVLLDMREHRMGLIQTSDQLRFSYMAIIEGARGIMGDSSVQKLSPEDRGTVCESHPALTPLRQPLKPDDEPLPCLATNATLGPAARDDKVAGTHTDGHSRYQDPAEGANMPRKRREERITNMAQKVQRMKIKLSDTERQREQWLYWRPILLNIGAGAALALGVLVCWIFSR
ncbi:tyrosine-protein phosphatase non-receptor type 2-like [Osmerus mordax]|uniref:tyrosine-protein phosphatase non-receptor type 2-like n=1 Tax=Osmerus mordax TaxID=8014 RepID=UPI003510CEE6